MTGGRRDASHLLGAACVSFQFSDEIKILPILLHQSPMGDASEPLVETSSISRAEIGPLRPSFVSTLQVTRTARNGLLSPRQRALEQASEDTDLLDMSSLSLNTASPLRDVHLDLPFILACEKIYKQSVAKGCPCSVGRALSMKDRDASNEQDANFTYGEVQFRSMAFILEQIRQKYGKPGRRDRGEGGDKEGEERKERKEGEECGGVMQTPGGGVFYDIGSGTGKPCFAAAALFPFKKVVGIEVLGSLVEAAQETRREWEERAVPALAAVRGHVDNKEGEGREAGATHGRQTLGATRVEFVRGDFRDSNLCDWPREADVCLANSTCFDAGLMQALASQAAGMRRGSIFVTFTHRLPCPEDWEVVDESLMMMSWGGATVFTQRKKTAGTKASG